MAIKLPNGKIARTIAEQVYKNMQDILFLMNKKDFQILVVEELPEEGSENTLYLVPSDDPEQDNVYTEYIWTGSAFEMVGTTAIDISNMVTTDTNQQIIGEKTFEAPVTFYDIITLNVDAAFEGDVLPNSTDSYDLGSDTYAWHDFYMQGLLKIKSAVNTFELKNAGYYIEMKEGSTVLCSWGSGGLAVGTSIYPNAANKDLGQAANLWRDFYVGGSINGSGSANLDIKNGTTTLRVQPNGFVASDYFIPLTANGGDLGVSGSEWRNLYLGTAAISPKYQVGSSEYTYIGLYGSTGAMHFTCNTGEIRFSGRWRPTSNGSQDIGDANYRLKDVYLSGVLSDGTNSVNVADLKALIDYAKAQGWIS